MGTESGLVLEGKFERRENYFDYGVVSINSEDIVSFWEKNRQKFTEAGEMAYARSLRIPPGFFKNQSNQMKKDLIVAQSHTVTGKLVFLTEDGVSPLFAQEESPYGSMNPFKTLGLSEEEWVLRRLDVGRGVVTLFQASLLEDREEYQPSLRLQIPVLYGRGIILQFGMMKLRCTNGLIDATNVTPITITPKSFSREFMGEFLESASGVLREHSGDYGSFIQGLRKNKINLEEARQRAVNQIEGKNIPKTVLLRTIKHIDLLMNERDPELPVNLPPRIESSYDYMDTITYFAQGLNSSSSEAKTEKEVFKTMWEGFGRDFNVDLPVKVDGQMIVSGADDSDLL